MFCGSLPACTTPASTSSAPDAQVVDAQALDAAPPATVDAAETAEARAAAANVLPVAQWRLDDALAAQAQRIPSRTGVPKPGLIESRGSAPVDKVIAAFGARAKAVATCARHVADAPPLLRVRAAIDPQGRATWVLTDYRVTLPEAAQSCVESALRSRPFALATLEGMTVTYAYAFADP
jgi:hypothetical protein